MTDSTEDADFREASRTQISPIQKRFDLAKEVDRLCKQFEEKWKAGSRRPIEQIAAEASDENRFRLIEELIPLEVDLRRREGDEPRLSEYRQRFPKHARILQSAFAELETVIDIRKSITCPHCGETQSAGDTVGGSSECTKCGEAFRLISGKTTRYRAVRPQFDRFELDEEIGEGTYGSVWKARDQRLNRTVALKIPRQGDMTETELKRFLRDAQAAATLRHPNIVAIHEVLDTDEELCIVSEFIDGQPLTSLIDDAPLSPRLSATLCEKVASALAHAHGAGVVHRDLKPANIMVDAEGEPRLIDFGLARNESVDTTMTQEGNILGTPAYMSPEQARGSAHSADGRSDLYSLGVILFELLTGERPFRGKVQALLNQVINEPAPSPRRYIPELNRDLETICLKCMEKEPEQRFQSTAILAAELRRFLNNEPIQTRPATRIEILQRWAQRNPLVASLVALLLIVALGASAKFIMDARRLANEHVITLAALNRAEIEEKAANEAAAALREQLYINRVSLAQRELRDGRVERAQALLDECPAELRRWEWRYLNELCRSGRPIENAHADGVLSLSVMPDHEYLLTGGRDHSTAIWNVASGKLAHRLVNHDWDVASCAVSPDGSRIVTGGSDRMLKLYDRDSLAPLRELRLLRPVSKVAWTKDGAGLVVATADPRRDFGELMLIDAASLETTSELWDETAVAGFSLAPEGGSVAIRTSSGNVAVRTIDGTHLSLLNVASIAEAVSYSPDGETIAVSSGSTVALFDPHDGSSKGTLAGAHGQMKGLAWSPSGRTIAAGSSDGLIFLWDVSTFEMTGRLAGHSDTVTQLEFVSEEILSSGSLDGTIRTWDIWHRNRAFQILGSDSAASDLQISGQPFRLIAALGSRVSVTGPGGSVFRHLSDDGLLLTADVGPDRKRFIWSGTDARLHHATADGPGSSSELLELNDVLRIRFDPSGARIAAVGTSGVLNLIDTETLKKQAELKLSEFELTDVAWSPDGNQVATVGRDGMLRITSREGEIEREIETGDDLTHCVAWSLPGIVTGGSDSVGRLWSPANGDLIREFRGHTHAIRCLTFSDDGARLVSGSRDRSLRVWSTHSGDSLVTLSGHSAAVLSVAFDSKAGVLVSGDSGGRVLRWYAD